jgi:hypothetical protein
MQAPRNPLTLAAKLPARVDHWLWRWIHGSLLVKIVVLSRDFVSVLAT